MEDTNHQKKRDNLQKRESVNLEIIINGAKMKMPYWFNAFMSWQKIQNGKEIMGLSSGFGLNDVDKCLTVSKDVFDDWVRTHLNAKGLKNKLFPHFDNFVIIFGRDSATGAGVETAADAVEGESEDDDEFLDEMNNECETSEREHTVKDMKASSGATNRRSIKRAGSSDGTYELVQQLADFRATYKETFQEIKGIPSFFKNEAERADRMFALPATLDEIIGFSEDELTKVGTYISKDQRKVDFFLALPKECRPGFVRQQLDECSPYNPFFDQFPSGHHNLCVDARSVRTGLW
ncbi:hypothetical protein PTKIN_Ptkin02bG0007400 [Pterospermum kingtungense]